MRTIQVQILGLLGTALPVQYAIADPGGERAPLIICSSRNLI